MNNSIDWQSLTKPERLQQLKHIEIKVPHSYKQNSIKEELVLQYVKVFERQYVELFHQRERLLLVVRNEFGVKQHWLLHWLPPPIIRPTIQPLQKFISTFVKPTLLPYSELYDVHPIIEFLHNYLTYEPSPAVFHHEDETTNAPLNQLPHVICSPTLTLMHQKGDAFDLAVLYCSLLRGSGYDAYVCIGHATGTVARGERQTCPEQIINDDHEYIQYESFKNSDDTQDNDANKPSKSKYTLKKRIKLESDFDKNKLTNNNSQQNNDPSQDDTEEKNPSDYYIHAWILVLPNARSTAPANPNSSLSSPPSNSTLHTEHLPQDKPYFIETSTGEEKRISDPNYLKIESLFSHQNYWVNMQEDVSVADTDFDLYNLDNWEYIFVQDASDDENDMAKTSSALDGTAASGATNGISAEAETVEAGEHDSQVLDLPTSWVGRISLSKEQFYSKYPGKQKQVNYEDATIQLYTPYSREDCLTKSIILFDDPGTKQKKTSEHLFYENRADKLIRRSMYTIKDDSTGKTVERSVKHEWFAPGRRKGSSIEALKEVIQVKGLRNEYRFYWDARLDGLEKRIEEFDPSSSFSPRKIILEFKGRSDFLSYRSVTYDLQSIPQNIGPDGTSSFKSMEERSILKMSEKFERDSSKIADEDVAKRTFFLKEGRIRLLYHYGPDKITHAVREYTKSGDMSIDIVDPFQARPKLSDAISEYKELLSAEKNCEANVRAANVEMKGILETRQKDEQNVKYVTSIYDTLLNQPTAEEIAELKRKELERLEKLKRKDVLGSLYPKEGIKSEEQAREIFKKCLRNMRKRLLERARILEARLTHEKNQINRRLTAYQKTQEGSERNEEEFVKFWDDAMFRMHIIRKRVDNNKTESKQEYAQLQEELLNDERLAPFLQRERQKFFSQSQAAESGGKSKLAELRL